MINTNGIISPNLFQLSGLSLSPFLYISSFEPLAQTSRQHSSITAHSISLYADNILLFINKAAVSIQCVSLLLCLHKNSTNSWSQNKYDCNLHLINIWISLSSSWLQIPWLCLIGALRECGDARKTQFGCGISVRSESSTNWTEM